jgi:DinB superfamily
VPLPPLAAEHHACAACGIEYRSISVEQARCVIEALPPRYRSALEEVASSRLRCRPSPDVWSPLEYLCHVRDVFVSHLIRLHRARTEHDPALEPMFNDLRARRLRYVERDPAATLDELDAAVAGLLEEAARFRPEDWARPVHRLPGEGRTALWLLRNAAHEGVHHLGDLRVPPA